MTRAPFHILFVCSRNSVRSILAEAILNRDSGGAIKAFSAGLTPDDAVDPRVITFLQRLDFPTHGLRTKSWRDFTRADAPRMDVVITMWTDGLYDGRPVLPGQPLTAHWSIPDARAAKASAAQTRRAFAITFSRLETRIGMLLSLPVTTMDAAVLKHSLDEIGEMIEEP